MFVCKFCIKNVCINKSLYNKCLSVKFVLINVCINKCLSVKIFYINVCLFTSFKKNVCICMFHINKKKY